MSKKHSANSQQSSLGNTDGRNPPRDRPSDPNRGGKKGNKLSKANYYGILLYIQLSGNYELHMDQVSWIVYYSRRLSIPELQKAGKFFHQLSTNETIVLRTNKDIQRIYNSRIPLLRNVRSPEPRRIGTGYHDKGALRPRHRPRLPGEQAFWISDIEFLLPNLVRGTGEWITSDEVFSQVSIDTLLMIDSNLRLNLSSHTLALHFS